MTPLINKATLSLLCNITAETRKELKRTTRAQRIFRPRIAKYHIWKREELKNQVHPMQYFGFDDSFHTRRIPFLCKFLTETKES